MVRTYGRPTVEHRNLTSGHSSHPHGASGRVGPLVKLLWHMVLRAVGDLSTACR